MQHEYQSECHCGLFLLEDIFHDELSSRVQITCLTESDSVFASVSSPSRDGTSIAFDSNINKILPNQRFVAEEAIPIILSTK